MASISQKKSWFYKFMVILTFLFAFMQIISFLLLLITPKILGNFAGITLLTPVFLVMNLFILVYWVFKMQRYFWITFFILILGFPLLNRLYQVRGIKIIKNDDLKIMSFNVRLFNKYDWIKDDSIPQKIEIFIREKSPDIICLQDYVRQKDFHIDYLYKYEKFNDKKNQLGQSIFSKYPIVHAGSLDFEHTANNILFADIKIKNDTIRVYNVHLQSIRLNLQKEYFGEKDAEQLRIRISKTFQMQQEQVEKLLAHQEQTTHPIIVAGDFNNTAFSWAYQKILKGKRDPFVVAGAGFDATYDYLLPLRIDFVLVDKKLKINHFKTFRPKYSDHNPIMVRIDYPFKE